MPERAYRYPDLLKSEKKERKKRRESFLFHTYTRLFFVSKEEEKKIRITKEKKNTTSSIIEENNNKKVLTSRGIIPFILWSGTTFRGTSWSQGPIVLPSISIVEPSFFFYPTRSMTTIFLVPNDSGSSRENTDI